MTAVPTDDFPPKPYDPEPKETHELEGEPEHQEHSETF
jgi:hypothetical protein